MAKYVMVLFFWLVVAPVLAATGRLTVSDPLPNSGDQIAVGLVVDLSEENGALGAYAAKLVWNPAVLSLVAVQNGAAVAFADPQRSVTAGQVRLSQFAVAGERGTLDLARFVFEVVGQDRQQTGLDLSFEVLDQAGTFVSLLPQLQVQSALVEVRAAVQPVVPYPLGSVRLSTPMAEKGASLEAEVLLDVSGVGVPVGAYEARLMWDASVLKLVSVGDGTTRAFIKPQQFVAENRVVFSNLNVVGETGKLSLLTVLFEVVGTTADSAKLDLSFQVLDEAGTFASLLPQLQIETTLFRVGVGNAADFDGNGVVEFSDFLVFAGKYGTQSGDTSFDVRCDLDGSGAIDFGDFLIFTQRFGASK